MIEWDTASVEAFMARVYSESYGDPPFMSNVEEERLRVLLKCAKLHVVQWRELNFLNQKMVQSWVKVSWNPVPFTPGKYEGDGNESE